jgi:hypothetical protein
LALQTNMIGIVQFYYDGATPPAGVFDEFLAIPTIKSDLATRSLQALQLSWDDEGAPRYIQSSLIR